MMCFDFSILFQRLLSSLSHLASGHRTFIATILHTKVYHKKLGQRVFILNASDFLAVSNSFTFNIASKYLREYCYSLTLNCERVLSRCQLKSRASSVSGNFILALICHCGSMMQRILKSLLQIAYTSYE
jgi:hypothetical protein